MKTFKFTSIVKTGQVWFLLLFVFQLNAQQIETLVKGLVVDELGTHMSHVTVTLVLSKEGCVTNANGYFELTNLSYGQHHLKFSYMGMIDWVEVIKLDSLSPIVDLDKVVMKEDAYIMNNIVITATKTEKNIEDVPIPVTVVDVKDIRAMGSIRLGDVLQEQTGMTVVADHGNGIQIQGFDADYTLILIDGQPIVGRTSGTLDLDRITVNNIKQIEITKGPSSSLYGSEALAGVINIITEESKDPLVANFSSKYRTYNTRDLGVDLEMKHKKVSSYINLNNYASDGYDLTPETLSKTSAAFDSYTVGGNIKYEIDSNSNLRLNGRYFIENQFDQSEIIEEDKVNIIDFEGEKNDWNLSPVYVYDFTKHTRLTLNNYSTGYNTRSDYYYNERGNIYSEGYFNQLFNKSEAQLDYRLNKANTLTVGSGYILETLKSNRYRGVNKFGTKYGFIQNDWSPRNKKIIVLLGARYDGHSVYASQLSPKLAVQYKLKKWISFKGAFATGYKAPDFRQLFLDFTNPTAGYSVFGSNIVQLGMEELEESGQIQAILIDPSNLDMIKAERSIAYNFGFDLKPGKNKKVIIRTNLFRNDIKNMIESAPIALKTNGQQVYTYFNLSKVYTQGLESEFRYSFSKSLRLALGYQYLEAKDKSVIDQLEEGTVFAIDPETNNTYRVDKSSYGGLYNRSKYSGNVKLFYINTKKRYNFSLRGIYRGRFGFGDLNNNAILDSDTEYVKAFTTWNFAFSKQLLKEERLNLQFGIDNIMAITRDYISYMPGRFIYIGASYRFARSKKQ